MSATGRSARPSSLSAGRRETKVVITIIPASDVSGTRTIRIDLIRDEVKA